jgi:hypothetical protein
MLLFVYAVAANQRFRRDDSNDPTSSSSSSAPTHTDHHATDVSSFSGNITNDFHSHSNPSQSQTLPQQQSNVLPHVNSNGNGNAAPINTPSSQSAVANSLNQTSTFVFLVGALVGLSLAISLVYILVRKGMFKSKIDRKSFNNQFHHIRTHSLNSQNSADKPYNPPKKSSTSSLRMVSEESSNFKVEPLSNYEPVTKQLHNVTKPSTILENKMRNKIEMGKNVVSIMKNDSNQQGNNHNPNYLIQNQPILIPRIPHLSAGQASKVGFHINLRKQAVTTSKRFTGASSSKRFTAASSGAASSIAYDLPSGRDSYPLEKETKRDTATSSVDYDIPELASESIEADVANLIKNSRIHAFKECDDLTKHKMIGDYAHDTIDYGLQEYIGQMKNNYHESIGSQESPGFTSNNILRQ